MQINLQDIEILCGDSEHISRRALPIFADSVCDFLACLSEKLLRMPEAKAYPDVITYAFYCRRGNIQKLKQKYSFYDNRMGRGLTFHVAPSNIPINFAYTLTAGLLAGNACIVKASSKDFPQTRLIAEAMRDILEKPGFSELQKYIHIVIYSREHEAYTALFSENCNVRLIWGGDETIANIRKTHIPARAFDITFADRYSISIMDAEAVLQCDKMSALAQHFYNDTYLYDQNACSAPRLIYWMGKSDIVKKAQQIFWSALYENIALRYQLEAINYIDKYVSLCEMAMELDKVCYHPMQDNRIVRISTAVLDERVLACSCKGGTFIEYTAEDYDALLGCITEKVQTVSYYGIDAAGLMQFVIENGLKGIDRIVPVGQAVDFDLMWDGYDLILAMSREISIVK